MTDSKHQGEQLAVVDFVDDPGVTGPDSPFPATANQLFGQGRPGICAQNFDGAQELVWAARSSFFNCRAAEAT
jgi:hypothetical protein